MKERKKVKGIKGVTLMSSGLSQENVEKTAKYLSKKAQEKCKQITNWSKDFNRYLTFDAESSWFKFPEFITVNKDDGYLIIDCTNRNIYEVAHILQFLYAYDFEGTYKLLNGKIDGNEKIDTDLILATSKLTIGDKTINIIQEPLSYSFLLNKGQHAVDSYSAMLRAKEIYECIGKSELMVLNPFAAPELRNGFPGNHDAVFIVNKLENLMTKELSLVQFKEEDFFSTLEDFCDFKYKEKLEELKNGQ